MSQGTPPPIPRRPIPVAPVQAIPVAAIPVSSDMSGSIGYSTPRVGRPGIISAIGIISIIVGSLSMLGSLGQSFYVTLFYTFSRAMTAAATATTPAGPITPFPTTTRTATTMYSTAWIVENNPKGFSPAHRDTVIAGLKRVRSLSDQQTKNLEALLEKNGQDIILLRGAKLTAGAVMKNVSDSGTLPSATGTEGPAYFELGQGRIEVSDTQAAFFPPQGEVIRASSDDGVTNAGTIHPSGLSDAEITAILARVQQPGMPPLNGNQIAGLTTELQTGTHNVFVPSPSPSQAGYQIVTVTPLGNGLLQIQTNRGWIQLDSKGAIVSSWSFSTAGPPAFNIHGGVALALILEGIASFLLAIYLLVIGILTLRQSPRGGRLHMIYAVIKIPLAITAGVGFYFLMSGIFSGIPGSGMNSIGLGISMAMGVIFACIYPIALLITLRTRAVREYYATSEHVEK